MHGPQMLHRMCGGSVNKAVHVVATIYCVHLVRQYQKLDLAIPNPISNLQTRICMEIEHCTHMNVIVSMTTINNK